MKALRLRCDAAAGLATAVLAGDPEAFGAMLADPDLLLPDLCEQAAVLLRLALGFQLAAAGLPWQAPAVAALWHRLGAEVGFELKLRFGLPAADLARPLAWLGDVLASKPVYVPDVDQALHLAALLQALALLWALPLADWRMFCIALADTGD